MSTNDSTPDPTAGQRCPECRHAPHASLGFCPNMASDNDCPCSYAIPPADDVSVRLTQPMGEQGWVSHRSRDGLQGARHTSTETCPWCPEASSSASEGLTVDEREALAYGFAAAWASALDPDDAEFVQTDPGAMETAHYYADLIASTVADIKADAEAKARADERERIAQVVEEECPHEPDEHPEGCCEVCDFAFAVAAAARGDA